MAGIAGSLREGSHTRMGGLRAEPGRRRPMSRPLKIAIIGTSRAGRTLATGLVSAGHDVVFGSRHPRP
ncbi:MAG TPA: NAD(P)-binding domain-containing protein, partial [Chloroflexota bacterium]|nr:NAD(P)-binding domain-containing protein [Chloroflexota bacterium]